jgi:hypothetical protein
MEGILDFDKEFDVALMDQVVMAFYTGSGAEVCTSQSCIGYNPKCLKSHSNKWLNKS